ncbi:MAG: hypothetical protein ACTSSE_16035 [Candidatus Thorarchaeota archaeon]
MDKTPEYIEMCQKARHELLANWKADSGDFVYSDLKKEVRVLYFSDHHGYPPKEYTAGVFSMWLPRQDQLQSILYKSRKDDEGYEYGLLDLLESFQHFTDSDYPDGHHMNAINFFDTFEKAWLMFYMLKIHVKIWVKEDWVSA